MFEKTKDELQKLYDNCKHDVIDTIIMLLLAITVIMVAYWWIILLVLWCGVIL